MAIYFQSRKDTERLTTLALIYLTQRSVGAGVCRSTYSYKEVGHQGWTDTASHKGPDGKSETKKLSLKEKQENKMKTLEGCSLLRKHVWKFVIRFLAESTDNVAFVVVVEKAEDHIQY